MSIALTLYSKPSEDFGRQLAEIESAKTSGIIAPTLIMPPLLTNGKRTDKYLSGDIEEFKDNMSVTNTISRADMADLCLKLGEKVVAGEKIPQWVAIRNP